MEMFGSDEGEEKFIGSKEMVESRGHSCPVAFYHNLPFKLEPMKQFSIA